MLKRKNKFSRKIADKEFRGFFMTAGWIVLLELFSLAGFNPPGLPALLLTAVIYSAFNDSVRMSLINAAITMTYSALTLSEPHRLFYYTPQNFFSLLVWMATISGSVWIVRVWRRTSLENLSRTLASVPPRVSDTQIIRMDAFSSLMPVYVSLEGRWINVPRTLCKFLGYSESELLAKSERDVTHTDDYEIHWKELQRVIRGEIPSYDYEKRLVRKDKRIVWVSLSCSVVKAVDGVPLHFAEFIRDITDRKAKELQLHESEERFRALIENSQEAVSLMSPEGIFLYTSPAATKILGYESYELVGRNHFDFMHPGDLERTILFLKNLIEVPHTVVTEQYRYRHKNGAWCWIEAVAGNLLNVPSVQAVVLNYRDITERKIAEETLRQSETRYKQLVETATDIIYRIDPKGFFTYANSVTLRVTGYTQEEIIGTHFLRFMKKDYRAVAIDLYSSQVKEKIPNTYFEFPSISREGKEIWIGQNVQIVIKDNEVVELQSMARDITERKHAQEMVIQSEAKFRSLIQNSTDIITIVDSRGIVKYESPSIDKIFGVPSEQLIGINAFEYIHRDDLPSVMDAFNRVVHGELQKKPVVYRYRHKDGSWRHLESVATNLLHDPAIDGIVINSRDITERILDEENIKRTSSLLNATLESTADGILVVDNEGKWISFNQKFLQMWGVPDEVIASRDDGRALEFALSKLKNPDEFMRKVLELYGQPDKTSFDFIEFKDGRTFERFSQPQRIGEINLGRVWSFRDITVRRKAEENLKESQANLLAVMENTEDSIWSIDPEYKILTVNSTFRKLFSLAYGAALAPGMIITDYLPAETKTVWIDLYQRALRGEQFTIQQHFEFAGMAIDVDVSFNPIYSPSRDITGVSVFSRNVTEKKKTEDTLRENEERYIQMFEKNRAMKWFVDPETGQIVDANPAAAEFYGYSLEQLKSMNIFQINILPKHEVLGAMDRARAAKQNHFQFRHCLASGEIRDVEVHSGPVMVRGRKLLFSVIHDITERNLAEDALRRSEEKYRSIFENIAEGIYQSTEDGRFLTVSPSLIRMLGYQSAEEVMQLNLNSDVFADANIRAALNRQTRKNGVNLYAEVNWKKKDGSVFSILLNDRAVYDAQGKFQYYEVTVEDISERKKLEQHLFQAQKTESIGRIAGGVAHDMNNMLAVILPTAEMLKQFSHDSELVKKYAEVISNSTRRASEIVKQLLVFARQKPPKMASMKLNELIRETQKMLDHFIGKNIKIELHLETLPLIEADMTQLQQVLMNLCVNARDAMPKGGVLRIATRIVHLNEAACRFKENLSPGYHVEWRVSDTGCGMAQELISKIFEAFFSTKEVGQGTGLGLAVVKSIVLNHHGSIEVESLPDHGATFIIFLPIPQTQLEPILTDTMEDAPKGAGSILIVDDEEEILRVCTQLLSGLGYRVFSAGNGPDALTAYRAHPTDLVLIDIQMPGMDGRETLKQLRLINPMVKAMYLTGYASPEILKSIDRTREAEVIEKPFSTDELAKAIRKKLLS